MPSRTSSHVATAGGLGLLALGAALGAVVDARLNLRVMHVMLATAFILLTLLMLKVQIGRFYRPDKGPGDWVAWLHFVIFAFLLFLAARMLRRWAAPCPAHDCAQARVQEDDLPQQPEQTKRLIVTYRGHKYDGTEFVQNHPGGSLIWKAHGRDVEEAWREHGVAWHGKKASIDKMIRSWPRVEDA